METRGIRFVSPPPKTRTVKNRDSFTTEDFVYNEKLDIFICPAGSILKCIGGVKGHPNKRRYGALRSVCGKCYYKHKCTRSSRRTLKVSVNHGALIRLRADSKTDSFRQLYRSRAPVVEGIFAEAKQWHGLRRAWRRGLSRMRVQCFLIAAVLNLKRLVGASNPLFTCNMALKNVAQPVFRIIADVLRKISKIQSPETITTC